MFLSTLTFCHIISLPQQLFSLSAKKVSTPYFTRLLAPPNMAKSHRRKDFSAIRKIFLAYFGSLPHDLRHGQKSHDTDEGAS
jgi:hypothetical protein